MIVRMIPIGSMMNTVCTALVESSPGMIIPYSRATVEDTSSMSGNVTSIYRMPRKDIFSLMVRSQAI